MKRFLMNKTQHHYLYSWEQNAWDALYCTLEELSSSHVTQICFWNGTKAPLPRRVNPVTLSYTATELLYDWYW